MIFNADFLEGNLIAQKDYAVNVLKGINYIEQYIKIITSVNGNSFETPQFGTERDECSIGKLPIAYTEYLCAVFNSYYEKRRKNGRSGDDEIDYFPQYFPLIVPYMIDGNSDCMMSTLFSQRKYKDVSSLLVSSFHEPGHYSNRITRRE